MKHIKLFEAWKRESLSGEFLTLEEVEKGSQNIDDPKIQLEIREAVQLIVRTLELKATEITSMPLEYNDFLPVCIPELLNSQREVQHSRELKRWRPESLDWSALYRGSIDGLNYCLWKSGGERGEVFQNFSVGTRQLLDWLIKKQRLRDAVRIEDFVDYIVRDKALSKEDKEALFKQYRGYLSGKKFGL
jgi:hypothetical protein